KRAHFVVVQADLTFGALNTFLDTPAHASHPYLLTKPAAIGCKYDIGSDLTRIADAASEHQPALPAFLHWIAQLHAPPVIAALSLTACTSAESLPACTRQFSQN